MRSYEPIRKSIQSYKIETAMVIGRDGIMEDKDDEELRDERRAARYRRKERETGVATPPDQYPKYQPFTFTTETIGGTTFRVPHIRPGTIKDRRKNELAKEFRQWCKDLGIHACYVCEYRPPSSIPNADRLLNVHHIVPIQCYGPDIFENLLMLCATHHQMAHAMWPASRIGFGGKCRYYGPRNAIKLKYALIEAERKAEVAHGQAASSN